MTKEDCSKFWEGFTSFIKQEVNDSPAFESWVDLNYNGNGVLLVLIPQCTLWASELSFLSALADRLYISLWFNAYECRFEIW